MPLIPVVLWGTQRLMTKDHPRDFSRGKTIGIRVGEPMHPDRRGPRRRDRRAARPAAATLLDEAIAAYPAEEQPPGSWWLPASHGGSAPTPGARPRELDAEEKARAARKAAAERRPDDDPDVDHDVDSSTDRYRFVDKSMIAIDLSVEWLDRPVVAVARVDDRRRSARGRQRGELDR